MESAVDGWPCCVAASSWRSDRPDSGAFRDRDSRPPKSDAHARCDIACIGVALISSYSEPGNHPAPDPTYSAAVIEQDSILQSRVGPRKAAQLHVLSNLDCSVTSK